MALVTTLYIQHGKAKAKATEVSNALGQIIGRTIPIGTTLICLFTTVLTTQKPTWSPRASTLADPVPRFDCEKSTIGSLWTRLASSPLLSRTRSLFWLMCSETTWLSAFWALPIRT